MKRRGFLGIMGGAVVAGPRAAKQAVTAASKSMSGGMAANGITYPPSSPETEAMVSSSHKSYLLEQVAKLRRRLTGQLTEEELEERRIDSDARRVGFEIETSGLRSMSESGKYSRMSRYAKQQAEERDVFYSRRRLNQYIKELAGMDS